MKIRYQTSDIRNKLIMDKGFEQIVSWRKARELNKEIYLITDEKAFSKDFGTT
ncbi:MAG: hypothetical protein ABJP76_13975 [Flavobacteriaceae bacterium]